MSTTAMKQGIFYGTQMAITTVGWLLFVYWHIQIVCAAIERISGKTVLIWPTQMALSEWALMVNITILYFFAKRLQRQ